MSGSNPYNTALDKNAANYTPLSPLSLIARTAYVYPQRVAVIHGATRLTWSEVYARCRRVWWSSAKSASPAKCGRCSAGRSV